jgi:hypothetical protein
VRGRIANAKIFGWAIYAAGFAIWLFGYFSKGHAPVFDWKGTTPWWISSFVPISKQNSDLRLASRAYSRLTLGSLIPLRDPFSLRGGDPRLVVVFGATDLARDLRDRRVQNRDL